MESFRAACLVPHDRVMGCNTRLTSLASLSFFGPRWPAIHRQALPEEATPNSSRKAPRCCGAALLIRSQARGHAPATCEHELLRRGCNQATRRREPRKCWGSRPATCRGSARQAPALALAQGAAGAPPACGRLVRGWGGRGRRPGEAGAGRQGRPWPPASGSWRARLFVCPSPPRCLILLS